MVALFKKVEAFANLIPEATLENSPLVYYDQKRALVVVN